jgi:hypothetical protein
MVNRLEFDDLNSLEKVAALELIQEAKRLWKEGGITKLPFEEWLSLLKEEFSKASIDISKK